mmetsp:Transcript_35555/g.48015  ORF Transcript_35555/g.48015 Transcript_35555/m.48015 type:complete len:82 (+) Transcript_35555:140-385(+)
MLGIMLSYTKLDIDNPTLREWSLVVTRNLCSWSEKIRNLLSKLELIEVSPEGKKTLDNLGMKEQFMKQLDKLKREDKDGNM